MMFDLEVIAQFFHHLVVQIRPIICNNTTGDTVAANDLVLDKLDHHLLGHISIRCSFDPFGEIVNSHENEAVPVGSLGFDYANHVNAPHRERLGRGKNIECSWQHVNLVWIDLTFMTFSSVLVTISFHCHPVVACSQYLFGHRVPAGMSAKGTFVYFMHQQICFVFVHAYEQYRVKVSFVQNISV